MKTERQELIERMLMQRPWLSLSDAEKWMRIKYNHSLDNCTPFEWIDLIFAIKNAKIQKTIDKSQNK